MYSPSGHPICRWVCFFIRTDLNKFIITPIAHQWILCSEWVPSEWESKQMIKNIPVIHTTPVPTKTLWSKTLFLTSNYPLYCILQWKCHSTWISREICTDHAPFTSKNSSKHIYWWILMWEDNRGWTQLLAEALLSIMDLWKRQFKFKKP